MKRSTLELASFLRLTPFIRLGTVPRGQFLFRIIRLTLFLLSQQVLLFCEHRVNFLQIEVFPSLSRQFPLFESRVY